MKYLLLGIVLVLGVGFFITHKTAQNEEEVVAETEEARPEETDPIEPVPLPALPTVTPISHATMVLTWNDTVLYTDPVGGSSAFDGQPAPDIVLITDIHGDHLNQETLEAVVADGTTLVMSQAVADELPESLTNGAILLADGDTTEVGEFVIVAIPMYNLPESDESRHIKGRGNGYIIETNGERVYVAGDTAGIPEMRALTDIDIAFIPMNLPYTMDVDEAASAVLDFKPSHVYPYHYRTPDGFSDVSQFKELVNAGDPTINVVLLNWYPGAE